MGQGVPRILDDCILVDGAADLRQTGWDPRPRWLVMPLRLGWAFRNSHTWSRTMARTLVFLTSTNTLTAYFLVSYCSLMCSISLGRLNQKDDFLNSNRLSHVVSDLRVEQC